MCRKEDRGNLSAELGLTEERADELVDIVKNVVEETNVTNEEENIIKEIEKILGRSGYIKLRQPGLPGECKVAYVKDTRIIVISDTHSANDIQIQSIKSWHRVELGMAIERSKEIKG